MSISGSLYGDDKEDSDWVIVAGRTAFNETELVDSVRESLYCMKYDVLRPCMLDSYDFTGCRELETPAAEVLVAYLDALMMFYFVCYNAARRPDHEESVMADSHRDALTSEWEAGIEHVANCTLVDASSPASGGGPGRINAFVSFRDDERAMEKVVRGADSIAQLRRHLQGLPKPPAEHVRMVRVKERTAGACTIFGCDPGGKAADEGFDVLNTDQVVAKSLASFASMSSKRRRHRGPFGLFD